MRSTNRHRLAARGRLAALLILAMASGRGIWAANSPSIILRAAAAQGKSGVEVRLRWSLTDGWLPDGGFNLYRSDRTTPLNSAPLGATSAIANTAQINIGVSHAFQLGKLLQKARQAPSITLPSLAVVQAPPPSAEAEFDRLAVPPPASPPSASTPSAAPMMIGPATAQPASMITGHPVTLVPAASPSIAEATLASRRTLLLGAALHDDVSHALGLSFDDPTVTPGQTYTYTLRPISNGTEGAAIATVTLTVPTDVSGLKPPAPKGLRAIQTGADTVALRWQRLSPQTESDMGVAKYDVYRKRENTKQEKLNNVPVLVVNVGTPGPMGTVTNLHEPRSFFTDTAAVTGKVEYQIVVTDIFDRSSDPANLILTVADLHKPNVVPFAGAQLQALPAAAALRTYRRTEPFNIFRRSPPSQPVLIAWKPSPDSGVAYRIYRADTENPAQPPQSLTPTPVPGTGGSGTALPAGSIREALAAQECSRLAHAGLLSAQSGLQNTSQGSLNSSKKGALNASQIPSCNLASLTGDDRATLEQTLLSSVQVLTWTDSSAQKDHYYRYYVASVFTGNGQEATPIQSNIVAYPDLTPPGMPTGQTAQFQPAAATQTASAQSGEQSGTAAASRRSGLQNRTDAKSQPHAGKARSFTMANWSGPLTKAPPRDAGGMMVLEWQPVAGAVKYEVYRANVTRITAPANRTPRTAGNCPSSPGNAPRPGGIQTPGGSSQASGGNAAGMALSGYPVVVSMPICIGVALLASVTWQVPLQDSDFVLLGTARTTQYEDALSRSSAHYYQYRIVPVNRWNVPGSMAAIDARAPATQPPTAPKLLVGAASPDGGAQVEFLPDSDSGEEVIRYELLRSNLYQMPASSDSTPASTASAASSSLTNSSSSQSSSSAAGQSSLVGAMKSGSASMTGSSSAHGSARTGTAQAADVPARTQLAGTAARYGITLHQPIMADAARAGTSIVAAMQASMFQAHTVAQVNATDLPAASNTGAWLADTAGGLDWRRDYVYVVKATDKDGLSSVSEPVDVTPLKLQAGAPANVAATWNTHVCGVDLTWQSTDPETANFVVERLLLTPSIPVSGPTSCGPVQVATTSQGATVKATMVTRSAAATAVPLALSNGPDYIQLSMSPATSYTDPPVFPDNSYQYRVRTVDQAGNLSAPAMGAQTIRIPDGCGSNVSVRRVSSTTSTTTRTPAALAPARSGATAASPAPSIASGSSQMPTVTPAVLTAAIPVKGVTTLTFQIQNTTSSPLTGLALSSTLPAGLVVALPNALANTCGGKANAPAWMNSLTLTGGTIPANGSCVVSVKVTGTTAGQKQVNAVVTLSGASPLTSNSTTITVLQTSPGAPNPGQSTPSKPADPQRRPAQPTTPNPRKAVPA
ncbi:MAG TPA: hypothetical protein VFW30_06650 [Bryocella sp.]|nr:hypothetical protein [Bryocella sp.]